VTFYASWVSAQQPQVVLDRDGGTIALEAYAPNIIRVTVSLLKEPCVAPPGFGFIATPSAAGWTRQKSDRGDVYRSSRLVVTVGEEPSRPSRADGIRYCEVFQWVGPAHAHHDQYTPRQSPSGYDWLVNVSAQSQRRQRKRFER